MKLLTAYRQLLRHFGRQGWWPAETRFEVVVGAVLTQNTNWKNVEKAIGNLKSNGMLTPEKISKANLKKLEKLIMSSGYYRQKAERLREVAKHFITFNQKRPMPELRAELLSIKGVGPETADSILLYAYNKPVFVIDAYTRRFCERHGLFKGKKYEEYRSFFEGNLPKSVPLYKEFHALIVELGKNYCKKEPACENCPLGGYL